MWQTIDDSSNSFSWIEADQKHVGHGIGMVLPPPPPHPGRILQTMISIKPNVLHVF